MSPLAGIDYDNRTKKQGVYKIVGKGHKGWSPNVDKELGNYDYLLGADVKTFIRPLVLASLTLAIGRSSAPRCPKRYERLVRLDLTGLFLRSKSRCPKALMNEWVRPLAVLASASMLSSTWTADFFCNG